jgi:hypothetical protein
MYYPHAGLICHVFDNVTYLCICHNNDMPQVPGMTPTPAPWYQFIRRLFIILAQLEPI